MKARVIRFAATGLVAAMALVGCSSSESAEPAASGTMSTEVAALYEAAKNENPITWYSSYDPPSNAAAVQAFQKAYPGLRVDPLRLTSGQLNTRFSQEFEANAKTADVITNGDSLFVTDAGKKGWLTPLKKDELPAVEALPDEWFHDGFPTTVINVFGIAYNTEIVNPAPKTWDDVLDPKYKGKVVFGDYRASSLYAYQGGLWAQKEGPDYLEKLKSQEPIFVDSIVPGIQKVASGEAAIGLVVTPSTITELVKSGAPLAISFPDDWYSIQELLSGVSAKSASPNSAKLFVNWLLTEEGQKAIVSGGGASPINSEGSIPLGTNYIRPDYTTLKQDRALLQGVFKLP